MLCLYTLIIPVFRKRSSIQFFVNLKWYQGQFFVNALLFDFSNSFFHIHGIKKLWIRWRRWIERRQDPWRIDKPKEDSLQRNNFLDKSQFDFQSNTKEEAKLSLSTNLISIMSKVPTIKSFWVFIELA